MLVLAAVFAVVRLVLAQSDVGSLANVGSLVSGYGALGLVTWAWLSDRIKTKADLDREIKRADAAEEERNASLERERETLEKVTTLVVESTAMVARFAEQHLTPDGGHEQ